METLANQQQWEQTYQTKANRKAFYEKNKRAGKKFGRNTVRSASSVIETFVKSEAGEEMQGVQEAKDLYEVAKLTVGMSAVNFVRREKAAGVRKGQSKHELKKAQKEFNDNAKTLGMPGITGTGRTLANEASKQIRLISKEQTRLQKLVREGKGTPDVLDRIKVLDKQLAQAKEARRIGLATRYQKKPNFTLRARGRRLFGIASKYFLKVQDEGISGLKTLSSYISWAQKSVKQAFRMAVPVSRLGMMVGGAIYRGIKKGVKMIAKTKAAKHAAAEIRAMTKMVRDSITKKAAAAAAAVLATGPAVVAEAAGRAVRGATERIVKKVKRTIKKARRSRAGRAIEGAGRAIGHGFVVVGHAIATGARAIGHAGQVIYRGARKTFHVVRTVTMAPVRLIGGVAKVITVPFRLIWALLSMIGTFLLVVVVVFYFIFTIVSVIGSIIDFTNESAYDKNFTSAMETAAGKAYNADIETLNDLINTYQDMGYNVKVVFEYVKDGRFYQDDFDADEVAFAKESNCRELMAMFCVMFDYGEDVRHAGGWAFTSSATQTLMNNYMYTLYYGSHEFLINLTYEGVTAPAESYGDTDQEDEVDKYIFATATITYRAYYFDSVFDVTNDFIHLTGGAVLSDTWLSLRTMTTDHPDQLQALLDAGYEW